MYRLLVLSVVCVVALASPVKREANPCTPAALAAEQQYFAVAGDDNKFIECDLLGHPNVLACPNDLVWDESKLSCVYRFTVGGTSSPDLVTAGPGTDNTANPCTAENIAADKLFFAYPDDPSKFIQCDLWGDAYVVECPTNLVWNTKSETCASAFTDVGK